MSTKAYRKVATRDRCDAICNKLFNNANRSKDNNNDDDEDDPGRGNSGSSTKCDWLLGLAAEEATVIVTVALVDNGDWSNT
jgi:hypothetical protein